MAKKNNKKNESQGALKISREMIIYNSPDGDVKIDVLLQNENIWLPQDKIAELFVIDRTVVTRHIANILRTARSIKPQLVQKLHKFKKKVLGMLQGNLKYIMRNNYPHMKVILTV